MNYKESKKILERINKANNILLNCHRAPDPDSIGSVLAMKAVLEEMGKSVDVICPTPKITEETSFLKDQKEIKLGVDFQNFPFDIYDLFITLDTSSPKQMMVGDTSKVPVIETIVIDHHHTNTLKGKIKLIDELTTSVGEMLYLIFEDWGTNLDENIAECLLTSIIGDTGAFSYPGVTPQTLMIVAKLMEMGADKDMIVTHIFRSEEFKMLKFWGEVLSSMKLDKEHRFVYSLIPHSVYSKYGNLDEAKSKAAGMFGAIVKDTDFGFVGVEEKENSLTISFRGRTGFDTSKIAEALGGGGHKVSSGARIENANFEDACDKLLAAATKYAKKGN